MVHSDWSDWLPRAIDAADPDGVAGWYLGCNGFALKADDGTTLFVDPYLGTGDPPRTVRMIPVPFDPADVARADAVLASHEHTDHVHGPSQGPLLAAGARFYGAPASVAVAEEAGWAARYGLSADRFVAVEPGERHAFGAFTVHVEPGHDPDAEGDVAFVVEHDAGTFVHVGDSRPHERFERLGERYDVDVAAVAFGSVGMIPDKRTRVPERTRWYNDENQVVELARALRADRLLPTHWDMWKGLTADPGALCHHARSFEYPRRIDLVEIGDRFDLGEKTQPV